MRTLSRATADRLLSRLETHDVQLGAASWAAIARATVPTPRTLLRLPTSTPGSRPGPNASPLAHAMWQIGAWDHARAQAARKARRQGCDPVAAAMAVGELADFGLERPAWAAPAPASAYGNAPGPFATPEPFQAVQRASLEHTEDGDQKLARLLARQRAEARSGR